jgi:hypothetical protein
MNYNIWFLFEQFRSLSISDRVLVVLGYILVMLLITLMVAPHSDLAKKPVHTKGTGCKNGKLYKVYRGVGHLLNKSANSGREYKVDYERRAERNEQTYRPQWHIHTIVGKLKRIVNHSGTEPLFTNPSPFILLPLLREGGKGDRLLSISKYIRLSNDVNILYDAT